MPRGLAARQGLEGASRVPDTSGPFCQTDRAGLPIGPDSARQDQDQGRFSAYAARAVPARPGEPSPGDRPGRVGREVGPGAVERELARLDLLDHPRGPRPGRRPRRAPSSGRGRRAARRTRPRPSTPRSGPGRPRRPGPGRSTSTPATAPSSQRSAALLEVDVPVGEVAGVVAEEPDRVVGVRRDEFEQARALPGGRDQPVVAASTHSANGMSRMPRPSAAHLDDHRRAAGQPEQQPAVVVGDHPAGPDRGQPRPVDVAVAGPCRPGGETSTSVGAGQDRDQVRLVVGVGHRAVRADQAADGDRLAVRLGLALGRRPPTRAPGPSRSAPPRSPRPASSPRPCCASRKRQRVVVERAAGRP